MLEGFFPKLYVDSIFHVPYETLAKDGVRGIIFDIDNTLVPYDIPDPTEEIFQLFEKLQAMGFKLCLLSNNNEARVTLFNKTLSLPAIHKAGKPSLKGINKAVELLNIGNAKAALIGDQIFTDVFCGNRRKLFTVLVKPVSSRDELTVRFKRGLESLMIKYYLYRRGKDGN